MQPLGMSALSSWQRAAKPGLLMPVQCPHDPGWCWGQPSKLLEARVSEVRSLLAGELVWFAVPSNWLNQNLGSCQPQALHGSVTKTVLSNQLAATLVARLMVTTAAGTMETYLPQVCPHNL